MSKFAAPRPPKRSQPCSHWIPDQGPIRNSIYTQAKIISKLEIGKVKFGTWKCPYWKAEKSNLVKRNVHLEVRNEKIQIW